MPSDQPASVPDRVRDACAWAAARARSVSVEEDSIEAYADMLPPSLDRPQPDPATEIVDGDAELRAAFVVCLDAINFGSGWWPTIRKRAGRSGYFTIAAGVTERFRRDGAWPATELTEIAAPEVAAVVGQDPDHPLNLEASAGPAVVDLALRRFGAGLDPARDLLRRQDWRDRPEQVAGVVGAMLEDRRVDGLRHDRRDVDVRLVGQLAVGTRRGRGRRSC